MYTQDILTERMKGKELETVMKGQNTESTARKVLGKIWRDRFIYLLLLPGLAYFVIFHYGPMYGLVLAFKKYNARLGIMGSPWVGWTNFEQIFITAQAKTAIINTLEISFSRLLFQFPVPIILAVLIDEMGNGKWKKIYQTVYTFPHFLSWVVVGTMMVSLFSNGGAINLMLKKIGLPAIPFLGSTSFARPMLYITANWKGMGWSSIIYLAAITGIDPTMYEAAYIDGAGRWKRIWYITIPSIANTIIVMLILDLGGMMNAGFDQVYNMSNSVIKNSIDIIDTYVNDITFNTAPNYGFSTAVGLFKSVINFALLLSSNTIVKKIRGSGLFG